MKKPLNILILDDQLPDVKHLKQAILTFAPGTLFVNASSKADFVKKINWMPFDLVLADYHLRDYTGLQALLFVKSNFPKLPFIFLIGKRGCKVEVLNTILSEANGYLYKNDLSQLRQRICAALNETAGYLAKIKAEQQLNNQYQLVIQQVIELVSNSNDFVNREKALELLQGIQDAKSHAHAHHAIP